MSVPFASLQARPLRVPQRHQWGGTGEGPYTVSMDGQIAYIGAGQALS